jgi:pre-rRNA-processing protein RIX1
MSNSTPTDLRVVCRKLASIPSDQLHHSLPSLVNHVLRCKSALAATRDVGAKGDKSETAMLVHKLKTSITTHLNSRVKQARFAAIALVKAAVDVGGWEVLRGSQPWVQGLLSIVQVRPNSIHAYGRGSMQLTTLRKGMLPHLKSWPSSH